jgi:hypothetical protein
MTIREAELFISITMVLLTYFICAPLVGYARARTAFEMGDDVPEKLGFLTLNPFEHVSRFWIIWIVLFQVFFNYMPFGLGRYIPINPVNIQGKNRGLKLAAAYFSETVAALGISIVSFFLILALHGASALDLLHHIVSLRSVSLAGTHTTTLNIIITRLLYTSFLMASLMAAFSLITNIFHFFYFYIFDDLLSDNEYGEMIMLFGPLLMLYVLIYVVRDSIAKFVVGVALLLAYMVGIVQ